MPTFEKVPKRKDDGKPAPCTIEICDTLYGVKPTGFTGSAITDELVGKKCHKLQILVRFAAKDALEDEIGLRIRKLCAHWYINVA